MLTKEKVLDTVKSLPEIFSVEEIIDRLVLLQKIEIGIEQAEKGQTLSTEEAKTRLKTWLK